MKKNYLYGGISICILGLLLVIILLSSSKNENTSTESLANLQEIDSTQMSKLMDEKRISPEKQKKLDQINEIYSEQEEIYNTTLGNILKKYKADMSNDEKETFLSLVENTETQEDLKEKIKKQLGLSILQNDIQNIFSSKEALHEEKELELSRLESFQEENYTDIKEKVETILMLSITDSLNQISLLNTDTKNRISAYISPNIFGRNHILDLTNHASQKDLLEEVLLEALSTQSSISTYEKQRISSNIIQNIIELEILLSPDNKTSSTSHMIPYFSFENIGNFLLPQVQAEDAELTPEERQILILKTEILIEKILAESIEIEIQYNRGEITQGAYQDSIEENLVELEELVILKESLENDESIISLEDIQRFNLGSYVDDSVAIEDLDIIAYIQEKNEHIIVYNLNGSAKLGEENMPLYAGYGIETLDNATATIIFSDESVLRLDPLSRVTITTPSPTNINVAVEQGTIWTRVLKPLLSGDIFTIESDGISLGVRGTSLALDTNASGTSIQVVDSYTSDGSPSVILTEIGSGNETSIPQGKEVIVDTSYNVVINDKDTATLLSEKPNIRDFIREDLRYLSLLLDDRKRGFHNTPFPHKNDTNAFIEKISGELENSLPEGGEIPQIISNTELSGELIQTGSIYHIIEKDTLITQIKDTPIGDTTGKIQAVVHLDMQSIEDSLGNKRELENRFDYLIGEDIVSEDTLTTGEVEDIFINFPIDVREDDAEHLSKASELLSINNGKSIVTNNISLPNSFMSVSIFWDTSSSSHITEGGIVTLPSNGEIDVILTANLEYQGFTQTKDFILTLTAREPTEREKLEDAKRFLSDYLISAPTYGKFIEEIALPDFAGNNLIVPDITWSGSLSINSDGTTNRPSFSESPTNEYKDAPVTAKIVHPSDTSIFFEKPYTIKIKRLPGTPEEIANAGLLKAKQDFLSYFSTRKNISNTLDYPPLGPGVVLTWANGSPYINTSGDVISRPSHIQGDENIDVQVTFSHPDTSNTETLTNIPLRIMREAITPVEQANLDIIDVKTRFENHFFGNIKEVRDILDYPSILPGVQVRWQSVSPYISSSGNVVQRPGYNDGNIPLNTVGVEFSYPALPTTSPQYITSGISLNMIREDCPPNGEVIGGICYELVATADYNSPGDFKLRKVSGGYIIGPAVNINLGTCGGDTTGNCGWASAGVIASKYGYDQSKITDFDKVKSWIEYDGEAGILVDNEDSDDYHTFDIESLTLGTDWAIEMSVRGEDLKRNTPRYYLFNSPGNFSINNYDKKIRVLYPSNTKEYDTSSLSNDYYKITFTKDKLYINNIEKINHTINLGDDIKIGSEQNNDQQWNGIINYLKIYKKY